MHARVLAVGTANDACYSTVFTIISNDHVLLRVINLNIKPSMHIPSHSTLPPPPSIPVFVEQQQYCDA
jgi:hypothetical protein